MPKFVGAVLLLSQTVPPLQAPIQAEASGLTGCSRCSCHSGGGGRAQPSSSSSSWTPTTRWRPGTSSSPSSARLTCPTMGGWAEPRWIGYWPLLAGGEPQLTSCLEESATLCLHSLQVNCTTGSDWKLPLHQLILTSVAGSEFSPWGPP